MKRPRLSDAIKRLREAVGPRSGGRRGVPIDQVAVYRADLVELLRDFDAMDKELRRQYMAKENK